uniref:Uncharacterized protein n=1 Tax=Arundo donax TaxID=35708 RepID=A0A0A9B7C1_ARUDO
MVGMHIELCTVAPFLYYCCNKTIIKSPKNPLKKIIDNPEQMVLYCNIGLKNPKRSLRRDRCIPTYIALT